MQRWQNIMCLFLHLFISIFFLFFYFFLVYSKEKFTKYKCTYQVRVFNVHIQNKPWNQYFWCTWHNSLHQSVCARRKRKSYEFVTGQWPWPAAYFKACRTSCCTYTSFLCLLQVRSIICDVRKSVSNLSTHHQDALQELATLS